MLQISFVQLLVKKLGMMHGFRYIAFSIVNARELITRPRCAKKRRAVLDRYIMGSTIALGTGPDAPPAMSYDESVLDSRFSTREEVTGRRRFAAKEVRSAAKSVFRTENHACGQEKEPKSLGQPLQEHNGEKEEDEEEKKRPQLST
jgi:hypothetical protein